MNSVTAGRLETPAELVDDIIMSPRLGRESKHLAAHLRIDLAHTIMLGEMAIISPADTKAISEEIIRLMTGAQSLALDPSKGSLLIQVERSLIDRLGELVGGRMHTGRSRIDHGAAVARLVARDQLLATHQSLGDLHGMLVSLAEEHKDTVMPGWTHLQHAQPWTLGHYLLRQAALVDRDLQRIESAYQRANLSSLGGAALVGSSWPLDRHRVSELLGHDGIVENAHDAGGFSHDWIMEIIAAMSIAMVSMGRLAGDLFLWHSWEFGLVEIADAFCGSSTIMPQKKNATTLEYVRGMAGVSVSWFVHAASVTRTASSTCCDHTSVPNPLSDAMTATSSSARLIEQVLGTMTIRADRMRSVAGANWSTASALADALVSETHMSFRQAHRVVATAVKIATDRELAPVDLSRELLDEAARVTTGEDLGLSTDWIQQQLDVEAFVASRTTSGGIATAPMELQLQGSRERDQRHRDWLESSLRRIRAADQLLHETARDVGVDLDW